MQSLQKLTLLLLLSCSISIVSAQTYLNLDFETMSGDQVRRWSYSNNEAVYTRDSTEKVSGNYSYKVTRTNPDPSGGFFFNELPADLVQGKEIVIKAKIKTEIKNKGEANLYLIVLNKHGKILHSDDMEGMRLNRTSAWEKVNIKAKIDSNAAVIIFGGAWNGGAMTAWFDDFELFIDGQKYITPVPRTAPLTKNELAVLKKYCYPLESSDPNIETNMDLSILKKLTKDAKIVALGESSHGSSEIFKMNHRIIKYLTQYDNFNMLAFEANMPESNTLNKAILNQQFDQINLMKTLYFWTWHTTEIRNLLNWMQDFNQGKPKIEFAGFDMQFYKGAIEEVKKALRTNTEIQKDLYEFEYFISTIAYQYANQNGKVSLPDEQIHRTTQLHTQIKTVIQKSNKAVTEKDWLLQNMRILEQYVDHKIGDGNPEEKRDRLYGRKSFMVIG